MCLQTRCGLKFFVTHIASVVLSKCFKPFLFFCTQRSERLYFIKEPFSIQGPSGSTYPVAKLFMIPRPICVSKFCITHIAGEFLSNLFSHTCSYCVIGLNIFNSWRYVFLFRVCCSMVNLFWKCWASFLSFWTFSTHLFIRSQLTHTHFCKLCSLYVTFNISFAVSCFFERLNSSFHFKCSWTTEQCGLWRLESCFWPGGLVDWWMGGWIYWRR